MRLCAPSGLKRFGRFAGACFKGGHRGATAFDERFDVFMDRGEQVFGDGGDFPVFDAFRSAFAHPKRPDRDFLLAAEFDRIIVLAS